MIRAVFIDPIHREIYDRNITGKNIAKDIGCDATNPVCLDGQDQFMYADETGLFVPNQCFFSFIHQPDAIFAGPAVCITLTPQEDSMVKSSKFSAIKLAKVVIWRDVVFAGTETTEREVDHPDFGRMWSITQKAKFEPRS